MKNKRCKSRGFVLLGSQVKVRIVLGSGGGDG